MSSSLLEEDVFTTLPDLLKPIIEGFEGRERDVVLLSSLGVISAILPNVYSMYDSNIYSPNLYIMIVAPPASGKGRMNLALKLINPIHKKIRNESDSTRKSCLDCPDKDSSQCPKVSLKIVPGNVSCSKLYAHLGNTNFGILIFESEADSLSGMLKQEWGNFSDVLRKAFHHEKISLSRMSDDLIIEVEYPKLSVILSGTENQLQPLIKSKENGLFSRFLYYYFNSKSEWKNISAQGSEFNFNDEFELLSEHLFELYGILALKQNNPVKVELTETQWNRFNEEMKIIHDTVSIEGQEYFTSSVKRHGVILIRIITILSILRNFEDIRGRDAVVADNIDFEIAMSIVETTIYHSLEVYYLLDDRKSKLPLNEFKILRDMDEQFLRSDAIELANSLDVKPRTLDNYLKRWISKNIIAKVSNGIYRKT
jgi:Protein of unknown function (DUF3987)